MEKHTPTSDLENQEFYIDKLAFQAHNSSYTGDNMPDGMDYQGVQWNILMHHTSRATFRARRTTTYRPHRQYQDKDLVHYPMKKEVKGEPYYGFEKYYKMRGIWCGHFQLKNNILAPTKTDLIYPYKSGFVHYCLLTFKEKKFLIDPDLHPVCIDYYDKFVGLAALEGELVLYDMQREKTVFSKPVINDKNINNCVIFLKHKYSPNVRIACGGNDDTIQIFDIQNDVKLLMMLGMTDAVNTLRPSPDTKLLLALGDKKEADIIDLRTGKVVMQLEGHEDFGFAGDWHPSGMYLATGNQDCTCRIWDIRNHRESVNVLQAHMDSPNAVKYSPTGSYLVVGENVDYVDVYNVDRNYHDMQVIDFFGEMNGMCFDGEEGDNLMIGALLEGFNGVFEFNVRKTEHMDVLSKMMF